MTTKNTDKRTPNPMKIAVVSITKHGIALAGKVIAALPGAQLFTPEKFRAEAAVANTSPGAANCYEGKVGDQVPALFAAFDGIVAIVSLGAVVRLIAPHLGKKETDPAVVVIDEAGKFVIPMLSGHLGGPIRSPAISLRRSTPYRY
jgi:cobalt-precorrin 5A hydrolase